MKEALKLWPTPNLLVGGPPCQGLSLLNNFKDIEYSKSKNNLVATFLVGYILNARQTGLFESFWVPVRLVCMSHSRWQTD